MHPLSVSAVGSGRGAGAPPVNKAVRSLQSPETHSITEARATAGDSRSCATSCTGAPKSRIARTLVERRLRTVERRKRFIEYLPEKWTRMDCEPSREYYSRKRRCLKVNSPHFHASWSATLKPPG